MGMNEQREVVKELWAPWMPAYEILLNLHGVVFVLNFLKEYYFGKRPAEIIGESMTGGFSLDDVKDYFNDASKTKSPIVFDLDGDGIETTIFGYGTYFDHDANGFAERTSWVGPDDGFLVMERNGNDIIDNGSELFGDHTILSNGKKAANGFQALAELDDNKDGKIDASDAAYAQLRIWRDMDGDGCRWWANGYRQKTISNNKVERVMFRSGFFS
jgi:hypothetical protein